MAVSKQNVLSSEGREVRSTPSRLLFSIHFLPLDLTFHPVCLNPTQGLLALLSFCPSLDVPHLPTYSSGSGLLPVTDWWAGPTLQLPVFPLHQIPGGGATVAYGEETRLLNPASALVRGGGKCKSGQDMCEEAIPEPR